MFATKQTVLVIDLVANIGSNRSMARDFAIRNNWKRRVATATAPTNLRDRSVSINLRSQSSKSIDQYYIQRHHYSNMSLQHQDGNFRNHYVNNQSQLSWKFREEQPISNHRSQRRSVIQQNYLYQDQRRTMMARTSSAVDPSTDANAKAMTFLVATLGHEESVAKGVISALKQSGISSGAALLSMLRTLAGRWEVDEDAGLEALVESVTMELARTEDKPVVKFKIIPSNAWSSKEDDDDEKEIDLSRVFEVEGFEDMSLTDVAKFGEGEGAEVLSEMMECSCSGIMACSTCHVVVANEWFEKVGEPSEAEMDMLDLAYNQKDTSRLGCQIVLKPELNNAVFKIPRGANNMMDFIPFED